MSECDVEHKIAEYAIGNQNSIYRLAFSYVKNADDALDIVQESIYKAISSKDSLKNPKSIKPWFYKIVVNTSLDWIRRKKRLAVADEDLLFLKDTGENDHYPDIDLYRALDSLPDDYRIVVVLRYFEDLKLEEIAEILNQNISTVKTHLYKSLDRLRVKMSDEG